MTEKSRKFNLLEDSAGALHLAVWDESEKNVVYYHSYDSTADSEVTSDIKELRENPNCAPEKKWKGNCGSGCEGICDGDPKAELDRLMNQAEVKIVCDEYNLYWDEMNRHTKKIFLLMVNGGKYKVMFSNGAAMEINGRVVWNDNMTVEILGEILVAESPKPIFLEDSPETYESLKEEIIKQADELDIDADVFWFWWDDCENCECLMPDFEVLEDDDGYLYLAIWNEANDLVYISQYYDGRGIIDDLKNLRDNPNDVTDASIGGDYSPHYANQSYDDHVGQCGKDYYELHAVVVCDNNGIYYERMRDAARHAFCADKSKHQST